jgi:hypothetical protein
MSNKFTLLLVLAFLGSLFCTTATASSPDAVPPMPTVTNLTQSTTHSSIQDAVDNAMSGDVLEAAAGTYNENVTIDKPLTLQSASGAGATSITGSDVALGTITLPNGSSDITIDGFTIVGFDGATPGLEKAAIYMQGAQTNITIINNNIVANGDGGLLSEFNAAIDNILIDGNEFSGQTFTGSVPGGCGFGTQFTEANVPRQLITMGGGSSVSNSMNVTFTNNIVSGTAGAPKPGCNSPVDYQGNTLVTIDVINATITGNTFNGATGRFATQLRVRGTNTTLSGNIFDPSNLGSAAGHVLADGDAFAGATPGSLANVQNANTFTEGSFISGSTIFPCTLASSGPLPGGWNQADVGGSISGNTYGFNPCGGGGGSDGSFTISSSAYNPLAGSGDNIAFAYQTICGDGMITAKVESIPPNGYAGLTIRESTAPGAKQHSIFTNLSNVLRLELRTMTNGPKMTQLVSRPFPFWLRIQRQGINIQASYSVDGNTFIPVSSIFLPMDGCVELGLAAFAQFGAPVDAEFSNVSISGGSVPALMETGTTLNWETNNQLQLEEVVAFPNPAQETVTLNFSNGLESETTVRLRNTQGQVLQQRQLQAGNAYTEWDISQLSSGMYFFEIHQAGQAPETLRVIKSN